MQNKCSFVCMHISKCLVGKGKTPSMQVAVEAGCMVASHVCTQEYIRDKSAQPLISPSISFLKWRSNMSHISMATILIFLRNIMWKLWRRLCSPGMTSKTLTKCTIWEIAEVVSGIGPEDLLCSCRETLRWQLYSCGWQRCFQLAQIHLHCSRRCCKGARRIVANLY